MRLWHGVVQARGFIFDEALIGRTGLVSRLSALWSEGARLAEHEGRWYLVGLRPRWVDSRECGGAPLTLAEGRWLAGPVADERVTKAEADSVLEWHGGEFVETSFSDLDPRHPADLLELSSPSVLEVEALSERETPVRAALSRPDSSLEALFAPMLESLPQSVVSPRPSFWTRVREWWTRFIRASTPAAPALPSGTVPAVAPVPEEPGWLARTWRRLTESRRLAKQREYLDDLRQRFAAGDLLEALKRSIPLGGAGRGAATGDVPERRQALELFAAQGAGPPAMTLESDDYSAMQALYRQAADALVAQGKVEEAAYVLAKLLKDASAAVALLEAHDRFELAARLATTEGLPEVDRIRLWLRAGRTDEAIRMARAAHEFGALALMLQTRSPELARRLREVWCEYLVEHDRYAHALTVMRVQRETPADWNTWVARAMEAGGEEAVIAVAVDWARHPEDAAVAQGRLLALFEEEERPLAVSAAQALLTHAPETSGPLYRTLWRRLMAEASSGRRVEPKVVEQVLAHTRDQALITDFVASAAGATRVPLELDRPAVASLPVVDVAPLPKDRRLLAHGPGGLRVLSRTGETLKHLLVKADALVVGPVGVPVLVVSRDGALSRVWKFNPYTFEVTNWFQGRLGVVASRFDGLCWAVSMSGDLVFLDPRASGAMEWWRVPSIDCLTLDAAGHQVFAVTGQACVMYEPGAQRSSRLAANVRSHLSRGKSVSWVLEADRVVRRAGVTTGVQLPPGVRWTYPTDAALLAGSQQGQGFEVLSLPWGEAELRGVAVLANTVHVQCRELPGDRLALFDEHGRVTEVDVL